MIRKDPWTDPTIDMPKLMNRKLIDTGFQLLCSRPPVSMYVVAKTSCFDYSTDQCKPNRYGNRKRADQTTSHR